jgi:hypothetical protein
MKKNQGEYRLDTQLGLNKKSILNVFVAKPLGNKSLWRYSITERIIMNLGTLVASS